MNKTPIVLCQPCVEEESSIDSQIIDNIVRFLSNDNKKGGPNSYINKVTKNAVLTACLFTQSTGLENTNEAIHQQDILQQSQITLTTTAIQSNNLEVNCSNKILVSDTEIALSQDVLMLTVRRSKQTRQSK